MTKLADDRARCELLRVYRKKDLSDVTPKELTVRWLSSQIARGYIAAFHYSKTFPDSSRFVFGLYYKDTICGVCVYGMGCGKNQYTAICPDIKNGEYIELTRLWLEDSLGKNSESYFISHTLRMLPKEIRFVVSFSDENQDHYGYIYQATNFLYLGCNGGGKMLITNDGIKKHTRLLGIYRMRHPELNKYTNEELMDMLHYKYVDGGRKFRYVYFRDKKLQKRLNLKTLPYPKHDNTGSKQSTTDDVVNEWEKHNPRQIPLDAQGE